MAKKIHRSSLTIPPQHFEGFKTLLNLSLEQSQALIDALGQAKSVSPTDLTSLVSKSLPSFSGEMARDIVQTILSLYFALASADVTVDAFVSDLVQAAVRAQVLNSASPHIIQSLTTILSVKSLSMISKARGIHIDHENIFCSVRILTDLRPVFDQDVRHDPVGFVVAHMLKLGFHHGGEHRSIHIAMDKYDIDTMIAALERAKAKASTVSSVIKDKAGLVILAD